MAVRGERLSLWRVFGIPLAIAVVSGIGLAAALFGDGTWDALSWLTLAVPVVVGGWCWWGSAAKPES
jgi:hypothetical protein